MACPQKENGYTPIANELFEAFYLHKFTEYQRVVAMFIWRKTYGWNKKNDRISNSQFVLGTNIPKGRVSETLKELLSMKVVTCTGTKLGINKNWEEWIVTCRGTTCYLHSKQTVTCTGSTKERKQENNIGAIAQDEKLSTKKTKMFGYNENKSFEEAVVDDETNEVAITKKPNKSYQRDILNAFTVIDPKNKTYYKNKTQLSSCDFLFKEYGLEKVLRAIIAINKYKSEPFFPSITSPYELMEKWSKFREAVKKIKNNE